MNFPVIWALMLRYIFLYTRTWIRLVELVFWPLVDLLVWGFLTRYLHRDAGEDLPYIAAYLIGAMILWDILFRAQQAVAISFLEDVWTNNLVNVFVAPIRRREFLAATFGIGILRTAVTVAVISVVALLLYDFNVFMLGWSLLPFFANLMLFGWALGMVSTALILRWGQAAEALAWAVPFFIQPVAAVFYPVDVMPAWLQPVARALPCSHIFEGMRAVVRGDAFPLWELAVAGGLNIFYLAVAGLIYIRIFDAVKRRGLLTKVVSH